MKQTSVEHIGRSQLIPGVGRTWRWSVRLTAIAALLADAALAQGPCAAIGRPKTWSAARSSSLGGTMPPRCVATLTPSTACGADDLRVVVPQNAAHVEGRRILPCIPIGGACRSCGTRHPRCGVRSLRSHTAEATAALGPARERSGQVLADDVALHEGVRAYKRCLARRGVPARAQTGYLTRGRITAPPNKGMKQTKPAQAMELRSLSPGWSQVNDATFRQ